MGVRITAIPAPQETQIEFDFFQVTMFYISIFLLSDLAYIYIYIYITLKVGNIGNSKYTFFSNENYDSIDRLPSSDLKV